MGSVVSSSGSVLGTFTEAGVRSAQAPTALDAPTALGAQEMRVLARTILDTEPSEIRGLLRQDPDLLRGWVVQLKTHQLQASDNAEVWYDALDHIRLCTLSPLKFAAE